MSIRSQFLFVMTVVFIVSLSLTMFWFNHYVQENIRGKLISEAQGICTLLKASRHDCVTTPHDSDDSSRMYHSHHSLQQLSASLSTSDRRGIQLKYVALLPENPANAGSYDEQQMIHHFNQHPDLNGYAVDVAGCDGGGGGDVLRYAKPIRYLDTCQECHGNQASQHDMEQLPLPVAAILLVDIPCQSVGKEQRGQLINLAVVTGMGYLMSFAGLALLLNYTVLRRLERLTRATQALTNGDNTTSLPAYHDGSCNEIDLLSGAFSSMQQAIEQREQALKKKHRQVYSMFHNHQSVMLLVNPDDHTIVDANAAAEQFYGFTKRELLQKKISELNLLPADQVSAELRDCQLGMKNFMQLSNRLSSGEIRDVEVRSCPLDVEAQTCLFMIIHDVTEQKRAELKVKKEHQFFQKVIDGIADPILVVDINYRIKVANKAGQVLIGRHIGQGDDLCCYQALQVDQALCADSCPVKGVLATGKSTISIKYMKKIHKSYEIVASPYIDEEGDVIGVIECFRDMTERLKVEKVLIENERKIHELIHYDSLTALPNRIALNDRLSQAIYWAKHQNRHVALLCLDLDRFKKINDTLGHHAGDSVLQEVASRLQQSLRDGDTIARVGGDDFFVVLENINDEAHVCSVIEKVLATLKKRICVDNHTINITASIGVALFPDHSDIPVDLMKFADIAMYGAKKMGGDTHVFYADTMDERASEFLVMETELKQAIEEQQLYLEYQPQFDLNDISLVGMEALVRWRHPEKGVISPGDFIPLAEETGLIQPIGEWVLREACRQVGVWRQEGLSLVPVAVNVSSLQMQKADFVHVVDRVLSEAQIPAECLELEITESAMMNRLDQTVATLQAIRKRGLKLAIDDFGTGYSSLSYLKRFPLSKLKIDRSFVRDLATDANDASITTAIIAMGQSLGLKVIAEGVENEAQKTFLIEKGCDQVQGFLYSRPLVADQIKTNYLI